MEYTKNNDILTGFDGVIIDYIDSGVISSSPRQKSSFYSRNIYYIVCTNCNIRKFSIPNSVHVARYTFNPPELSELLETACSSTFKCIAWYPYLAYLSRASHWAMLVKPDVVNDEGERRWQVCSWVYASICWNHVIHQVFKHGMREGESLPLLLELSRYQYVEVNNSCSYSYRLSVFSCIVHGMQVATKGSRITLKY